MSRRHLREPRRLQPVDLDKADLGDRRRIVWRPSGNRLVLLIAVVHLGLFLAGIAQQPLLAAASVANFGLVILGWRAHRERAWDRLILAFAAAAGMVTIFCHANLCYVALTDLPEGRTHELVAWLGALMTWSIVGTALGVNTLLPRTAPSNYVQSLLIRPSVLWVTGAVFAVYTVANVANGYLSSRWVVYDPNAFGVSYLISGLGGGGAPFAFFLVLGAQTRGSLVSPRNLLALGIAIGGAFLYSLSGGRETGIWIMMLFGGGALISPHTKKRHLLATGAIAAPVLIALFVVVGQARSDRGFGFGSVSYRVETMSNALTTSVESSSSSDEWDFIISRVFETSSVVVVDQVATSRRFSGFEHFERLPYAFLPKFLVPSKRELDDSVEVLARYGIRITVHTAVPITIVADCYRRGGVVWVLCIGILMGLALVPTALFATRVLPAGFEVVGLAILAMQCVRLYTPSVLGLVEYLTYRTLKVLILVSVVAFAARMLRSFLRGMSRQSFKPLPARRARP